MTDTTILETPKGKLELNVCKDGSAANDNWIPIYDISFPPEQRQAIDDLKRQLETGSMELDETRDQYGEILCMTITEVFKPVERRQAFLLACYTAVAPDFRGMGVGTIHRKKMERLLENEYPRYLGIFSEIESTKASGLPDSVMETRIKRKRFFLKLGLRPINIDYRFPSMHPAEKPLEGELLWYPFSGGDSLGVQVLADVLERIYIEGYGLRGSDPFISEMLEQLSINPSLVDRRWDC